MNTGVFPFFNNWQRCDISRNGLCSYSYTSITLLLNLNIKLCAVKYAHTMKAVINRIIYVVTWRPGLGRLISNWKSSLIMADLTFIITVWTSPIVNIWTILQCMLHGLPYLSRRYELYSNACCTDRQHITYHEIVSICIMQNKLVFWTFTVVKLHYDTALFMLH